MSNEKTNGKKIAMWIGICSASVTIVLSIYNAKTANEIENWKREIDTARQKVEKYDFVQKLFPSLISEDSRELVLSRNLIRLALDDEEYEKLMIGFKSSEDATMKEIGTDALKEYENIEIMELIYGINSENKKDRKNAYELLKNNHSNNIFVLNNLLELFADESDRKLNNDGLLNALKLLNELDDSIWTNEHKDSINRIIHNKYVSNLLEKSDQAAEIIDQLQRKIQ